MPGVLFRSVVFCSSCDIFCGIPEDKLQWIRVQKYLGLLILSLVFTEKVVTDVFLRLQNGISLVSYQWYLVSLTE